MAKVRVNMEVSEELLAFLDRVADREDTTRTEIVRRALSILKAYDQQSKAGRRHIGFTDDPTKLDAEIVGILSNLGDPSDSGKPVI